MTLSMEEFCYKVIYQKSRTPFSGLEFGPFVHIGSAEECVIALARRSDILWAKIVVTKEPIQDEETFRKDDK